MMNRISDNNTSPALPATMTVATAAVTAPATSASASGTPRQWLAQAGLAQTDTLARVVNTLQQAVNLLDIKPVREQAVRQALQQACYALFHTYGFRFTPAIEFTGDETASAVEFNPFRWAVHVPPSLLRQPRQFISGFCAALRQAEHLVFLARVEQASGHVTLDDLEYSFAARALPVNVARCAWPSTLELPETGRASITAVLRQLFERYGDFEHNDSDELGEGYRTMTTLPEVLRTDMATIARQAVDLWQRSSE